MVSSSFVTDEIPQNLAKFLLLNLGSTTDLRASLEGVRRDPSDPVVSEAEGGEAGERPHYPRVQLALEVVVVQLEAVQRRQAGEGVRRHGVQTVVVQVQHLRAE